MPRSQLRYSFFPPFLSHLAREYVKYLQQQIWTSSDTHSGFENYIKSFISVLTTYKLEFLTASSRNERFINVICLQSAAPQLVSGHFMTRNFVSIKQFTRKFTENWRVCLKIWGINNFARKLSSLQVHNWENCSSSWKTFSIKFKTGPRAGIKLDSVGGERSCPVGSTSGEATGTGPVVWGEACWCRDWRNEDLPRVQLRVNSLGSGVDESKGDNVRSPPSLPFFQQ